MPRVSQYDHAPTLAAGLIRLARSKTGLTQRELANRAGVSQQVVSAYETRRKEPTLPTLERLISAAGLELRVQLEPADDHDLALIRRELRLLPHQRLSDMVETVRQFDAMSRAANG